MSSFLSVVRSFSANENTATWRLSVFKQGKFPYDFWLSAVWTLTQNGFKSLSSHILLDRRINFDPPPPLILNNVYSQYTVDFYRFAFSISFSTRSGCVQCVLRIFLCVAYILIWELVSWGEGIRIQLAINV